MTTVSAIAAEAMDAVALDIVDAVHVATVAQKTAIVYDPESDQNVARVTTQTGRAVFAGMSAAEGMFPGYAAAPSDELLLLEGFTSVRQNDVVTIDGTARTVRAVQDIGGAGSLFYAVVR